jgi:hypothetical protein
VTSWHYSAPPSALNVVCSSSDVSLVIIMASIIMLTVEEHQPRSTASASTMTLSASRRRPPC